MGFIIYFNRNALKDKELVIKNPILSKQVGKILKTIRENPFEPNQSFETLKGNLSGYYSRRADRKNRVVYKVDEEKKEILIISLLNHYDNI